MSEGDKHDSLSPSDIGVLTECDYIMFISLRHRCPYRMWLSCLSPSNIGVLTECGYHVYLPQT
jgi:hypothetical protein